MKVMISAYSCRPNRGSEPGVGWNWVTRMAYEHDLIVITRCSNQIFIEEYIKNTNLSELKKIKFIYHESRFVKLLPTNYNQIADIIYYNIWQSSIIKRIKNDLEIDKIDIFHHVTYNTFKTTGVLYKLGKPVIFGPIGGGQRIPIGFEDCLESTRNRIKESIRNISHSCSHFKNVVLGNYRKFSAICVANQDTYKLIERIEVTKIKMLETAIDEKYLVDAAKFHHTTKEGVIKVLWVGAVEYWKGLTLLLQSVAELEKEKQPIKLEIVIIGEGSLLNKYKQKYRHLDNIEFKGRLSYAETLNEYSNADVFIFTSLRDTSGNVLLEAMSNELPIIAFNQHGARDILDNECALLIEPTNSRDAVNEIKKNILLLGHDKKLRTRLGENGRLKMINKYTWSKKIEEMNEIYYRCREN